MMSEALIVENAQAPMSDEYRKLLTRIVYHNFRAEAANASLKFHQETCPLHLAPTMDDRSEMGTYWAEECHHAVMFAGLLRDLGQEPAEEEYDLERPLEMLRLPVASWAEFGLFQLFADSAGGVHLKDYSECSYLPMREVAQYITKEEAGHIASALKNLESALAIPEEQEKVHSELPNWYRASMKIFGRLDPVTERNKKEIEYGLRKYTNAQLQATYQKHIDSRLQRLGLPIPELEG